MESGNSLFGYFISWLPYLLYLAIQIWLTFKIIRVLQAMVRAQEGILAKLTDMDNRLTAKPSRD
ncbi:hypothetical protein [Mesorhizobium caraganae]|uniref:hypothetical protein n=1 Tax=Mesorhizobium caraganae TaxID=483206 RepID=UPI003338E0D7